MKRTVVLFFGMLAFLACQKEKKSSTPLAIEPQFNVGNLIDYEYYTPSGDLEVEISAALLSLHDEQNLGYTDINRGIWILETGTSYLLPDYPYEFEDFESQTSSVTLGLNDNGLMSLLEIKGTLIDIYNAVSAEISQTKKHAGTNVKVLNIENGQITLGINTTYLTNATAATSATNCQLGSTNQWKVAGHAYFCPYQPGNQTSLSAWREASLNARTCLRNYKGPAQTQPPSIYYYTNIVDYSSLAGNPNGVYNAIWFSSDHLLGQPGSPLTSHQSPLAHDYCLSPAEQNVYVPEIYNDVSGLLGKNKGLIKLALKSIRQPDQSTGNEVCKWWYHQITVGENGYFRLQNQVTMNEII